MERLDANRKWLRHHILKMFGEHDLNLFDQMLEENDGLSYELDELFGKPVVERDDLFVKLLVLYRTYYDKVVDINVDVLQLVLKIPSSNVLQLKKKDATDVVQAEEEIIVLSEEVIEPGMEHLYSKVGIVEEPVAETSVAQTKFTSDDDDDDDKLDKRAKKRSSTSPKTKSPRKKRKVKRRKKKKKVELIDKSEPKAYKEYIIVEKTRQKTVKSPFLHAYTGAPNVTIHADRFVYFLRKSNDAVPIFDDDNDTFDKLAAYFSIGACSLNVLETLTNQIELAWQPIIRLVEGESGVEVDVDSDGGESDVTGDDCFRSPNDSNQIDDEPSPTQNPRPFSQTTGDFLNAVTWTYDHSAQNQLQLPASLRHSPDALTATESNELLETIKQWRAYIQKLLNEIRAKKIAPGLVAVLEHWQWRESTLSVPAEQLRAPKILRALNLLATSDEFEQFRYACAELAREYTVAGENVRFLRTVARQFRLVECARDCVRIAQVLPHLMKTLHMFWVLSGYYARDDRMFALMQRVAYCLRANAVRNVDVDVIFEKPLKHVQCVCANTKNMFDAWKDAYMTTRKEIEQMEKGQRWEFNRDKLFRDTDYCAKVCADLCHVLQALIEFENIFGPQLKSIINDPGQIDSVLTRVHALLTPIKCVTFDIFDAGVKENWQVVMENFERDVLVLENEANFFINDSFKTLRTAQDALRILMELRKVRTRASIERQLTVNFNLILQQFVREMARVEDVFLRNKRHPPLLRNHPPTSGAIYWSRTLFHALKRPMLALQTHPETQNQPITQQVHAQYVNVCKQLRDFERATYASWSSRVQSTIHTAFARNILSVVRRDSGSVCAFVLLNDVKSRKPSRSSRKSVSRSSTVSVARSTTGDGDGADVPKSFVWKEYFGGSVLAEHGLKFAVNFDRDVFDVIDELTLLERLRTSTFNPNITPEMKRLAMETRRINGDVRLVQHLIDDYNRLTERLTVAEVYFLRNHLLDTEMIVQAGVTRINWRSLAIDDFVQLSRKSLKNLRSVYQQISHVGADIFARIRKLQTFDLFEDTNRNETAPLNCKDFFNAIEMHRNRQLAEMLRIYETLTPILRKLETIVLATSTGTSPLMTHYYEFWERQTFAAFINVVENNLLTFTNRLTTRGLFHVDVALQAPDVVLRPAPAEIFNVIMSSVTDFCDKIKLFPRWINGTCIACPPVARDAGDEPFVYSFYEDVVNVPRVARFIDRIRVTAREVVEDAQKAIQSWRRYQNLWTFDKEQTLEEFMNRLNTLSTYDAKFIFYAQLRDELRDHARFVDVKCVRLNLNPVIDDITCEIGEWTQLLAMKIDRVAVKRGEMWLQVCADLRSALVQKIGDIEAFKAVMEVIADIHNRSVDAEINYTELIETYVLLRKHGLKPENQGETISHQFRANWNSLYRLTFFYRESLRVIKSEYAKITQMEVDAFAAHLREFLDDYHANGPQSVGDDMHRGSKLIDDYAAKFTDLSARCAVLLKAEAIFDLPLFDHTAFVDAHTQFTRLQIIYELYRAIKIAKETWSRVLWVHFDESLMRKTMTGFLNDYESLAKDVREMDAARVLEQKIRHFLESIPLMVILRDTAMRARHWQRLMAVTAVRFDPTPEHFYLRTVIQMKLHAHAQFVNDLVERARKELHVEQHLQQIADTWLETPLRTVARETRVIFAPVCEIVQMLDGHLTSLDVLSTSAFVAPFLPSVQKWQRDLTHVSDVVEHLARMQMKWLRLVGIFGSARVRKQLADESRKFDIVDKSVRKLVDSCQRKRTVFQSCTQQNRLTDIQRQIAALEKCECSLHAYLSRVRDTFPRFYFLSNDELLIVLGDDTYVDVFRLMRKLFNNITAVSRDTRDNHVTGFVSNFAEVFRIEDVMVEGRNVEDWMGDVVDGMRGSMRVTIKEALRDIAELRFCEWIDKYPACVTIVTREIYTHAEITEAIISDANALHNLSRDVTKITHEMVHARKSIANDSAIKLENMLILNAQLAAIVERLRERRVTDVSDFYWQSLLKFYWLRDEDACVARQFAAQIGYGYEYTGVTNRLFIRPHRSFYSIVQMLSLGMSVRINGSNTGLLEDFAHQMGRLFIHTTFQPNSFQLFQQTLTGMSRTNAWGFFANIHTLPQTALSIASGLLNDLKRKIVTHEIDTATFFHFDTPHLNLPQSLKRKLRPVKLPEPNFTHVAELTLIARGFTNRALARKIVTLLTHAHDRLFKRTHYAFKTALFSVLNAIKRTHDESASVLQAISDAIKPRLHADDYAVWNGLVKDLFPGVSVTSAINADVLKAIEAAISERALVPVDAQVDKCLEVFDAVKSGRVVMLVGAACVGKTTIVNVVVRARAFLGMAFDKIHVLDPQTLTFDELYGSVDALTGEWTNGVVSELLDRNDDANERDLIWFDGAIEPRWLEPLRAIVCRDTGRLTLPNGQRLGIPENTVVVFEAPDLNNASPRVISHAPIIYCHEESVTWHVIWHAWLKTYPNANARKPLQKLCDKYVNVTLRYIFFGEFGVQKLDPLELFVPQSAVTMVRQLCVMLEATLPGSEKLDACVIEALFIQALYYSLGACVCARASFDAFVKKRSELMAGNDAETFRCPLNFYPSALPTIYDYHVNVNSQQWTAWTQLTPPDPLTTPFIPTHETTRAHWLLKTIPNTHPLLLIGPRASYKTTTILDHLNHLPEEYYAHVHMRTSPTTRARDILKQIHTRVEKRSKHTHAPFDSKRLMCFVDDLSDCACAGAFKFLIERAGMWNAGNWTAIKNVGYVAACATDSRFDARLNATVDDQLNLGSFNHSPKNPFNHSSNASFTHPFDARLIAAFICVYLPPLSDESIAHVYQSLLNRHFDDFDADVKSAIATLVDASIRAYRTFPMKFRAVPAHAHYAFNMHTLSRVFDGLRQTTREFYDTRAQIVRVWRNELTRVVFDRFVSGPDLTDGAEFVRELIGDCYDDRDDVAFVMREPLLFGDFRNAARVDEMDNERRYEDLLDYEAVYFLFEEILQKYNAQSAVPLNMVLFEDALEHLTRIQRVLRLRQGHMLLIGPLGIGKKSLVRLASFAANCEMFEIPVTHDVTNFHTHLKRLYRQVTIERRATTFFVTPAHLTNALQFDHVMNLIACGECHVFDDDERASIVEESRVHAQNMGYGITRECVWRYLIDECRANLHVVICVTDLRDVYHGHFWSLIDHVYVNYMFTWSVDTLRAIVSVFVGDAAADEFIFVHQASVEHAREYARVAGVRVAIAPRQFVDFLMLFVKWSQVVDEDVDKQISRFQSGSDKIGIIQQWVDELTEELRVKNEEISQEKMASEALLVDINERKEIANTKKSTITTRTKEVHERNQIISVEQKTANDALDRVMPQLNDARAALNDLEKSDVTEIRSFATPPPPVQIVCECIAILLNLPEISFKSTKALMGDPEFLKNLQALDCNAITVKQQHMIRDYLKNIAKPAEMRAVSRAADGLLRFVQAVLDYCVVYKDIKVKIDRVEEYKRAAEVTRKTLARLNEDVDALERELTVLNEKYVAIVSRVRDMEARVDDMQTRLNACNELCARLRVDKAKWDELIARLMTRRERVVARQLFAAFLCYAAPFNLTFREKLFGVWCGRFGLVGDSFQELMSDTLGAEIIAQIAANDAILDTFSLQNAILTVHAPRAPLCIDPQTQALAWIRSMEKERVKVVSFAHTDWRKHLELQMQYGGVVVFDNVDVIDPGVYNLLERNVVEEGGRFFVAIAGKLVQFDHAFRCYLLTDDIERVFAHAPDVHLHTTIIDFTMTTHALDAHFSRTIRAIEQEPDENKLTKYKDEHQTIAIVIQQAQDARLRALATFTRDAFDHVAFPLELTADHAQTVRKQKVLDKKINEIITSAKYRDCCARARVLFQTIQNLTRVNRSYVFTLEMFDGLVAFALDKAAKHSNVRVRVQNIVRALLDCAFEWVSLGLFFDDRVLFAFLLAVAVQVEAGVVSPRDVAVFNSSISLTSDKYIDMLTSEYPEMFGNLRESIKTNLDAWKMYLNTPNIDPLPFNLDTQTDNFKKLLLAQLKPRHHFQSIARQYIKLTLTDKLLSRVDSPRPALTRALDLTPICSIKTPILIVQCANAHNELSRLRATKMPDKFVCLPVGGALSDARELLEIASMRGQWIVFDNVHVTARVDTMIFDVLDRVKKVHPDFRLWLTVDAGCDVARSLARKCLTVVYDADWHWRGVCHAVVGQCGLEEFHGVVNDVIPAMVVHAKLLERTYLLRHYTRDNEDFVTYMRVYAAFNEKFNRSLPIADVGRFLLTCIYQGRTCDYFQSREVDACVTRWLDDDFAWVDGIFGSGKFVAEKLAARLQMVESKEFLHASVHVTRGESWACEVLRKVDAFYLTDAQTPRKNHALLDTCQMIAEKMPNLFDITHVRKLNENNITPLFLVLEHELNYFNELLVKMRVTLARVTRIHDGRDRVDCEYSNVIARLNDGRVPPGWLDVNESSTDEIQEWVGHFERRVEQYTSWVHSGEPVAVWLTGLFRPRAYIAALLQMAGRKNFWPLENVTFYVAVMDFVRVADIPNVPETGCYVHGIEVESARWDLQSQKLHVNPRHLREPMPIAAIVPCERDKLPTSTFQIPVYWPNARLAFDCHLKMSSDTDFQDLILHRVCFVLN